MRLTTVMLVLLGASASTAALSAETHRHVPAAFQRTSAASLEPALRVRSGDRVETRTADPADRDGQPASAAPYTGPFFVHGAEPGDLLVVTFEEIEPDSSVGTSRASMRAGALEPGALQARPATVPVRWTIDRASRMVRLDLSRALPGTSWRNRFNSPEIELPLRPTLGSVVLASARAREGVTGVSGPYGGRMDFAGVNVGTTVMLQVAEPGALLFIGHGQARRGEGGVTGSGIEAPMHVVFRVEVVKRMPWPHSSVARPSTVVGEFDQAWPRLETADTLLIVASASTLHLALQRATLEMHHWLDDDFGLSEASVSLLLGQALEIEVADAASEQATVVTRVPKASLPRPAAVVLPPSGGTSGSVEAR